MKNILLSLGLISCVNGFFPFPNNMLSNGINLQNDNILPKNLAKDLTSFHIINRANDNNIIEKKYSLWDHFDKINHDKQLGINIVKKISAFLPKVDTIGHKVLHANNEFINDILNLGDHIPHETKKNVILLSIKMAQLGDDFGSHLLQVYYDLVDKCL